MERLGYKVSILSLVPNLRGNQLDNLDTGLLKSTSVISRPDRQRPFPRECARIGGISTLFEPRGEYTLYKISFLPRLVTIPLIFSPFREDGP